MTSFPSTAMIPPVEQRMQVAAERYPAVLMVLADLGIAVEAASIQRGLRELAGERALRPELSKQHRPESPLTDPNLSGFSRVSVLQLRGRRVHWPQDLATEAGIDRSARLGPTQRPKAVLSLRFDAQASQFRGGEFAEQVDPALLMAGSVRRHPVELFVHRVIERVLCLHFWHRLIGRIVARSSKLTLLHLGQRARRLSAVPTVMWSMTEIPSDSAWFHSRTMSPTATFAWFVTVLSQL